MAKYRILGQVFLAPVLYKEGDIVEWTGRPNGLMEPLDSNAHAAMDEYNKKHGVSLAQYDEPIPEAQLVEAGRPDPTGGVSLAEAMNQRGATTDQRPGPAVKKPLPPIKTAGPGDKGPALPEPPVPLAPDGDKGPPSGGQGGKAEEPSAVPADVKTDPPAPRPEVPKIKDMA